VYYYYIRTETDRQRERERGGETARHGAISKQFNNGDGELNKDNTFINNNYEM